MKRSIPTHTISGLALLCLASGLAAAEPLQQVKVTTDRSVDTSSAESIVKDVIKPGMSDEQKVIALLEWFERSVYHRPTPNEVRQNQHKVINVYGGVVCGTQGCQMADLCRKAGFEARVVCDANGGHTYFEVNYGGGWHGFDSMDRFWVYTRGEPRQVASFAEIDKDPSLVKDAVKENRVPPGFCFHGDDPMGFVSSHHRTLDYLPTAIAGLGDLSLVPGQRITWYWYNSGKIHPQAKNDMGFAHSCGKGTDLRHPVNASFWEPYFYATPGCHPDQVKRRMYANGEIVFEPDLSGKTPPVGFTELSNLGGPGLVPLDGKPGTALISIHSPYILVGGTLSLQAAAGADLGNVVVAASTDGKTFAPVGGASGAEAMVDLTPALIAGCAYDASVKLTLPDAKAAISGYRLELVFMHNKYVRPFLAVGDNTVAFSAKNPELLAQSPVTVEYAWQEGPNWDSSQVKKATQVVKDAGSSTWKIAVGGEKTPRMKSLTIASGKWDPAAGQKPVTTSKVTLKNLQFVNEKGEVAPTGRLQWPKNDAEAGKIICGAVLATGELKDLPKRIAAARLVVPFTKGSGVAPCKVGAVLLPAPVAAGKPVDVKALIAVKGTAILPKLPEGKGEFNPAELLRLDVTEAVRSVTANPSSFNGFAVRLVPDRAVDDGHSVGCIVSTSEPIVLEVDAFVDAPAPSGK